MWWKDLITRDWLLKILALSFSVLLWSFVVGQEKAEIGIPVPLEIVNLPPNLVIANDIPSSIELRVFGPRSIIKNIASKNLTKVIDLKEATPGKQLIHFSPDDFSLPRGLKVLRIRPNIIEISLEPLLRKRLQVKPVLLNSVAPGYEVERVYVDPRETQISGAAKEVATLKYLELNPINLKDARETFSEEVGLNLQGLHIAVEGPSKFKVTVFIRPAHGEKKIHHVPLRIKKGDYAVSVWPSEISVKLEGEKPALNKIKIEQIKATIDVSGLEPGSHKLTPAVEVPPGFKCTGTVPEKIKVRVKRKRLK
ncbi:MAG: hypothetical protein DSZ23_05195 [Thermodesulfatator sp.]|nr:MAG: hypothetical protein DSZ23_05195 [Thermodesulfatator sp.]